MFFYYIGIYIYIYIYIGPIYIYIYIYIYSIIYITNGNELIYIFYTPHCFFDNGTS